MNELTHERLLQILSYDKETGDFTWLQKPHPKAKTKIGSIAGSVWKRSGRKVITIYYERFYTYRLAWFYVTGSWPDFEIDHEDRDPANDRWSNLRPASRAQQTWNAGLRRNNTSGYIGVCKSKGLYRVDISIDGRNKCVGTFETVEEALHARDACALQIRGSYAVLNRNLSDNGVGAYGGP